MYKLYLFEQPERVPDDFITCALLLLPEYRCQKVMRYRQPIDRKNSVIAYLMLKIALKECFQITEFELRYGRYGKPYLEWYPKIHFNISHCRHGCIVAVSDRPIGVDIQEIRSFSWKVAEQVCCEEELHLLKNSSDRAKEFTRIWTMKESFVKMTGVGMQMEMKHVNVLHKREIVTIQRREVFISVCTD